MEEIIKIVQKALNEKRKLSNEEVHKIINYLMFYYQIKDHFSNIRIDNVIMPKPLEGNTVNRDSFYFNDAMRFYLKTMDEANEKYNRPEYNIGNSNEFIVFQQLSSILYEVRRILQRFGDFSDKPVIKEIFADLGIDTQLSTITMPIFRKDARCFATNYSISILDSILDDCSDINRQVFRIMYFAHYYTLVEGYNPSNYVGELKCFYEQVKGNGSRYQEIIDMASSLDIVDKMSVCLPLNSEEQGIILDVPYHILDGQKPCLILKKIKNISNN